MPKKLTELNETKPWIPENHMNTTWRIFNETKTWLEDNLVKQAALAAN